jgi:uncharacterized protein with beta-barrel porin domain
MPVTDQQIADLKEKFDKLVADKSSDAQAQADANAAQASLQAAQVDAALKGAAASQADAIVESDINDLRQAFDDLAGPPARGRHSGARARSQRPVQALAAAITPDS